MIGQWLKLARRGFGCAVLMAGVNSSYAQTDQSLGQLLVEAPPLIAGRVSEPANGRRIVADRRKGLCLLCHSGPFPEERFQGTLAPSLAGAGSRWTTGQLRLRLVDSAKINPQSIMPAYFRSEGHNRVGRAFQGQTILTAEEIEDVVAFLATLRD
jgi:L-cysteine S-thiosulfotransferase